MTFPDERLDLHNTRRTHATFSFGDALFDDGLSYCSCLHLARFIFTERKGINFNAKKQALGAEFFDKIDLIRAAITRFADHRRE